MDNVPESVEAESAGMGAIDPGGAPWRMIAEFQGLDRVPGGQDVRDQLAPPAGQLTPGSNFPASFDIEAGVRENPEVHESLRPADMKEAQDS
jgi:hypothetical protein